MNDNIMECCRIYGVTRMSIEKSQLSGLPSGYNHLILDFLGFRLFVTVVPVFEYLDAQD